MMMMFVPTFSPVLVTSLVCFFVVVEKGSSFTALSPSRRSFCTCSSDQRSTRSALFAGRKDDNIRSSNSDFPPDEDTVEYTGSVDWDAEWKKVVKNGGVASGERPGKEFYKSEAEIAAIRAANKATEQAAKLASKIPEVPSFDTLKGDWRFWMGLLVLISFGSALLTSQAPLPTNSSPDSFYV